MEEIDEGRGRQEDRISNFRKKKKSTRQEGAGGSNIQFPAEGGGVSSDATTGVSSGRPRPTLDATEPSLILSLPVSSHLVAYLLGETVKATKFLSAVPDYRGARSSSQSLLRFFDKVSKPPILVKPWLCESLPEICGVNLRPTSIRPLFCIHMLQVLVLRKYEKRRKVKWSVTCSAMLLRAMIS